MSTEVARPSRLFRIDLRLTSILFWVLLLAGVALRIYLVFTPAFVVDSDNAVVYLQTKHISEGELSWFFWGQSYGGTLLQLVAGAAMLVFGQHIEVLSVVSTLIFAVVAVIIRYIGTRAFDRMTGLVAGILFWFSGYYMLKISISESGFYGPSLALSLGAVAAALSTGFRRPALQWIVVGLLTGLAFWQSPMGAMIAAPAVVVLIVRQRSWRNLALGAAAIVVGALPWIIQLFASLDTVTPKSTRPNPLSVATFFTQLMPAVLSTYDTAGRVVVALVCAALLGMLTLLAIRRRSAWLAVLVIGSVLVVIIVSIGAGVLLSRYDVRYAVFVMPTFAIAVAWIVTRVRFLGAVAMIVAALLTVVQTTLIYPNLAVDTSSRYIVGDIAGLGDYLEENHITAAWGDYWISYAVSAETNEAAEVAAVSAVRRYEPYEIKASAQPRVYVIVEAGNVNDTMLQSKLPELTGSERTEVDGYAVYSFAQPFDVDDYQWALY
ncbi:ArnT family glycosyltransferase [Subtercola lobariae]|uniref:Glycosyltransferase RgtA/B/C/D-like domain-containing protein n=1 Tax=Subtercola lobariae TaxID=1588641 RepID=A0A917B193_9MICO|nr:hypothetical protein [Subtercola lobariae]GGF14143.1 hypothetical protein GCM10011399_05010 [Subtercola lobariae]